MQFSVIVEFLICFVFENWDGQSGLIGKHDV